MRTAPLLLLLPASAWCTSLEVLTLPNWQRVPVGELGMVEGGAVVARVDGPAAGFQNPAGLARLRRPSVSGSVSAVEYARVATRTSGGEARTDELTLKPNLVGFSSWWDEDAPLDDSGEGRPGFSMFLAAPTTWSNALEIENDTGSGSRRDNGRSTFEILVPGMAAGIPLGRDWSLGFGLEMWVTSYRFDSGTSASDGTTVLTSSFTESGRNFQLRATAGARWRCGDWRCGLLLRSPGWMLSERGEVKSATTSGNGTQTTWTEVASTDSGFDFRLPWSVVSGVAWRPSSLPALTIEADLSIYGPVSYRTIFSAATGTSTTLSAGPTVTTPYAIPSRTMEFQPVFNPSAGMGYVLSGTHLGGRTVTLHLGGFMDNSPVKASETFNELNLLGGTAGVTFAKGPMRATIGGTYVTNATLTEALGYVTAPGNGLEPSLSDPQASYAVRTFVLSIGSTYEF